MDARTLEALLAAAGQAPSGDNTQPWRFIVDAQAGMVALTLDETRDVSPMNAGQRMARIAIGAALENLLRAARVRGWDAELLTDRRPRQLAVVRLTRRDGDADRPYEVIAARATNRRLYDGRPVPGPVLDRMTRETPEIEGVLTRWIVGADRLASLGRLICRADALMFGEPSMRRAFLSKVRLDATAGVPLEEGLCPASLELSAADRLALRLIGRTPDWLHRVASTGRIFAAKAKQLVDSASGLCLISAPDGTETTDLVVGRAMQRAWLTLTAHGLAAQPMMSLLVLQNALEHGDPGLIESLDRERLKGLGDEFRRLLPEIGDERPAFLLRFGYASPPSGRTGRLHPLTLTSGTDGWRGPGCLAESRQGASS
jgi:nitroreductase